MSRLKAWVRENVIDTDPNPEYSRLDQMDGLQQQPSGLWIDQERFDAMAKELAR